MVCPVGDDDGGGAGGGRGAAVDLGTDVTLRWYRGLRGRLAVCVPVVNGLGPGRGEILEGSLAVAQGLDVLAGGHGAGVAAEFWEMHLEPCLGLVAVGVDPHALGLVPGALDVDVAVVPAAAAGLAPVAGQGVLVAVGPGDGGVGDADGVVAGLEQAVRGLLPAALRHREVCKVAILDLPVLLRLAKEAAHLVEEGDTRHVAAGVVQAAACIESNCDAHAGAGLLLLGESVLGELDYAHHAGDDADDVNDGSHGFRSVASERVTKVG